MKLINKQVFSEEALLPPRKTSTVTGVGERCRSTMCSALSHIYRENNFALNMVVDYLNLLEGKLV